MCGVLMTEAGYSSDTVLIPPVGRIAKGFPVLNDGSGEAAITTISTVRGLRPWRGVWSLVVNFAEPTIVKV